MNDPPKNPQSDYERLREMNENLLASSARQDEQAEISERDRDDLVHSRDAFFHLVERAPFGVYVVDSQLQICQANSGAQPVFKNVRPLIGHDLAAALRTIWPEPLASETFEHFRHTLETGESYIAPSLTHRRKDVNIVESYEWQIHPVMLPDRQVGVVCYFYESTKLRKAEEDAKQNEERFRHVFETAGVSVWLKDFTAVKAAIEGLRLEGVTDYRAYFASHPEFVRSMIELVRVVDVNEETLELFGAQTKAPLVESLANTFTPETEAVFSDELSALAEGLESLHAEAPRRRLDGSLIWVLVSIHFGSDDSRVVVTLTDITERRQTEELLRQLTETLEHRVEKRTQSLRRQEARVRELASQLTMAEQVERDRIGQVLHDDLQQLLYSVQVKLSLLRDSCETGERQHLRQVSAEVIEWVIEAVSKTRRLAVDLSPQVLEHEGLVEAVRWLATQMEEVHGLKVEVSGVGTVLLPKPVRILLFQIIRELLFNIVKHAGVNQAMVRLSQKDAELLIQVIDQGKVRTALQN